MADSLTILRSVLLEGKLPTIEGDDFILGRYRFNKNTLTAFRGSTGSNYNLGSVYFLHSNRTLNHGAYILAAARNGASAVAFNDKKELLQYLDGGEISSSIVFDSLPSTGVPTDIANDNLTSVQQDSTNSISNLESQQQQSQVPSQQVQTQSQQQTSTSTSTTTSSITTTSTQEPDQTFQSSTTTTSTSYTQELDQQDDYIYGEDMNTTDTYEDSHQFNQKIDPLILNDKELNATQIKDKQLFAEKIDNTRNINSKPETSKTEDSYLQEINQKRKNPSEKSSFIKADEEVTKAINDREKKSSDKISILQSPISFTNISNSYKKFKMDEEEEKRRKSRPQHQQISTPPNGNSPIQVPKNRTPIIIVPSSLTAPISLFNVQEFIQSSKFRPTLEKKTEMAATNTPKPSIITFDRITSQKITYEIIDNIKNLKDDDWGRVAAAFVQGESWQFKDWRWSNPTDLFSHIKGFYVRFDDMNIPDAVKSWDVKVLKISKVKRHLDHTAQVEFWNAFDEFVSSKKPYLKH